MDTFTKTDPFLICCSNEEVATSPAVEYISAPHPQSDHLPQLPHPLSGTVETVKGKIFSRWFFIYLHLTLTWDEIYHNRTILLFMGDCGLAAKILSPAIRMLKCFLWIFPIIFSKEQTN